MPKPNASRGPIYLRTAVPAPLSQLFDYLPPPAHNGSAVQPGVRVLVPFGRGKKVAVVVATGTEPGVAAARVRPAIKLLDSLPTVPRPIMRLAQWAADYYAYPLGDVMHGILPPPARLAKPLPSPYPRRWRLAGGGTVPPQLRAPLQAHLLERLAGAPGGLDAEELAACGGGWRRALAALVDKGLVEVSRDHVPAAVETPASDPAFAPNTEQAAAIESICTSLDEFAVFALEGVTGSGKTEVYLQVMQQVLQRGRQVLLLVPEIGLTPQLVARVRSRFDHPVSVLHSALTDSDRYRAWHAAREGHARVLLGTRSAVFAPLPDLGLIVVDEEHDASLKQQDGFRYHARDLAVVRAQHAGIPAVLGSATPSLETLANAQRGRYRHLRLQQRTGGAGFPVLKLVDLKRRPLREGLSEPLLEAAQSHLANGDQVLIFINRRGFAPTLLCHDCAWAADCPRCDSRLTLHRGKEKLQCHHCGHSTAVPTQCPDCASEALRPVGEGTERIEAAMRERFPDTPVLRIDRDNVRGRDRLAQALAQVAAGEPCILVGTQMLAKGHHFPHVTLVGVINADRGLYSVDFRAPEQLAQLIVQVAGRAGRAAKPGEVLIQTHNPEHPLLTLLIDKGYPGFSDAALRERRAAALPPFARIALLRAEANAVADPSRFLEFVRNTYAASARASGVQLLGPVPAPLERMAGRYRAQLLVDSTTLSRATVGAQYRSPRPARFL
jgi:primosomal protein N' (replication factor Y)